MIIFTNRDKILVEVLRQNKGYSDKKTLKEFPDKQWPHLALDRPLQEVDSGEGKGKMERGEGRQSEGEREGVERKRKDVKSQCYHCILETSVFF